MSRTPVFPDFRQFHDTGGLFTVGITTLIHTGSSNFFTNVGDCAKKYKMAIFKPKPLKLKFLGLVTHPYKP
jgi:hypothetical protein